MWPTLRQHGLVVCCLPTSLLHCQCRPETMSMASKSVGRIEQHMLCSCFDRRKLLVFFTTSTGQMLSVSWSRGETRRLYKTVSRRTVSLFFEVLFRFFIIKHNKRTMRAPLLVILALHNRLFVSSSILQQLSFKTQCTKTIAWYTVSTPVTLNCNRWRFYKRLVGSLISMKIRQPPSNAKFSRISTSIHNKRQSWRRYCIIQSGPFFTSNHSQTELTSLRCLVDRIYISCSIVGNEMNNK